MDINDAHNLRHIINAIEQLERYTRGMSENEFAARIMVQDAAARQVGIVSAAAKNVSLEFQDSHPKLPWDEIIGVQHRIIDADYKLNITIAWNIIQDDLPLLKHTIRKLLLA